MFNNKFPRFLKYNKTNDTLICMEVLKGLDDTFFASYYSFTNDYYIRVSTIDDETYLAQCPDTLNFLLDDYLEVANRKEWLKVNKDIAFPKKCLLYKVEVYFVRPFYYESKDGEIRCTTHFKKGKHICLNCNRSYLIGDILDSLD